MKKILFVLLFALLSAAAFSQAGRMFPTFGGATGAWVVPSAFVNYESGTVGLDGGYKFLYRDNSAGGMSHILYAELGFLKQAEVGFAVDIDHRTTADFMVNLKWQFSELFSKKGNSAMALGGNFQAVDLLVNNSSYAYYGQLYFVMSYQGNFFSLPARTSLLLGYTFQEHMSDDIDAGIAFELNFFPQVFKNYVYLICDFANFSYLGGGHSTGLNAENRAVFNTGLRFSLLNGGKYDKYMLGLDIVGTDLLDSSRGVAVAINAGGLIK